MSPRCLELIVADETRGAGVDGDPVRNVVAVYTKDGDRIAENDPYPQQVAAPRPPALEPAPEALQGYKAAVDALISAVDSDELFDREQLAAMCKAVRTAEADL